jgi:hypothetical protein
MEKDILELECYFHLYEYLLLKIMVVGSMMGKTI